MKNILVVSFVVALCSVGFASGELPGPRSYNPPVVPPPAPAPIYQPQYYAPAPVASSSVVVENRGFFGQVGDYLRNRAVDIGDIVCETVDGVVGLVGFDLAGDDQY